MAWLCQSEKCFANLLAKPHRLRKKFGSNGQVSDTLSLEVQAWHASRIKNLIQQANRDGRILSGKNKTILGLDHLSVVLLAQDIGTQTKALNADAISSVTTLTLPFTSRTIGDLLGKGPRSLLGIRPGRGTQSLIDGLRRWPSLG
jgi:ribosomal protein L7Ae-like RNA K-turn-binding protein